MPISVDITDFSRKLSLITVHENTRPNGKIKILFAGEVLLMWKSVFIKNEKKGT